MENSIEICSIVLLKKNFDIYMENQIYVKIYRSRNPPKSAGVIDDDRRIECILNLFSLPLPSVFILSI